MKNNESTISSLQHRVMLKNLLARVSNIYQIYKQGYQKFLRELVFEDSIVRKF